MKSACYYENFNTCGCPGASEYNKACRGKESCERFISEEDYFVRMMNGTLPEEKAEREDPVKARAEIKKKLSPGKTKKQLKFERKQEEATYGDGSGFSLKDDPRFRDLFK